jgi:hypothetical protein
MECLPFELRKLYLALTRINARCLNLEATSLLSLSQPLHQRKFTENSATDKYFFWLMRGSCAAPNRQWIRMVRPKLLFDETIR